MRRAWEIERDRKKSEEMELAEKRLEYVSRLIAAADSLLDELTAVPDDAGAKLDFIARLANFFPKSWEEWLVAEGVVPHRVEVAYARHRAMVIPLLEVVLADRAEFPTSPDRLLRTLATSFLLKDFDVIRRIQRDLPARLEPIRQQAREAMARIKEMQATKWKLEQERKELGIFSAMRGRTKAVIESEIEALDGDIVKEKQVVARLKEEAKQAKWAFELSRGDPAMRSILEAIGDEVALLEAAPTVTDAEPQIESGQPSFAPLPEADGTEPDQVEVEPWEVARRWASRHRHVVYWLSVALTFPLGLIAMLGVAASGEPLAAVCALPFAFLPLVFFGLATERTTKLAELRRLIVGKWQAKRADGVWQLEFTEEGKVLVNDTLTADYTLFVNLDLALSTPSVRDLMDEKVVSLDEKELIVHLNGAVCRFTRLTPLKPKVGLG
jgi:hypothetical protein